MHTARPSEHRRAPSPEFASAAYHEAGHAVAIVLAFRNSAGSRPTSAHASVGGLVMFERSPRHPPPLVVKI